MSNDAFDSIIINLVENIRSEMLNLTRDLRTLELNISTINRLEEKTECLANTSGDLKQRFVDIQRKFDHLENLVDELQEKISDVKLIESLQMNLSKANDRLTLIEQDVVVLKQREIDRLDNSKESNQFNNGVLIVIITAAINFFIWLLTGSK